MRYLIGLVLFITFCGKTVAQNKKLSLSDAVLLQRTTLAPKKLSQLQWIPGTNDFSYVDSREGNDVFVKGNALKEGMSDLLSLSTLNNLLLKSSADTLPKMPVAKWKDAGTLEIVTGKKIWHYRLKDNILMLKDSVTIPASGEVAEDDGTGHIAYVDNYNIYIESNHRRLQVTQDGSGSVVYGKAVHQEEFGIKKGLFWSPGSAKLAFYRMDQSMVDDYPIVKFSVKPAKDEPIKYPMAGGKSHHVTVGIYDVITGSTVYLKTGAPLDQYLTNIAWSPDEKYVFIAVLNREQNHMRLNQYDATTGAFVKTIFEELDEKYTEPLHPLVFLPGSASQFVWQSRRDGWNHLYLYDVSGKLIRQLTGGEWELTDFNGFDPKGSFAFFQASSGMGLGRDFYKVEIRSGKLSKISAGEGTHVMLANHDKTFFIDTYSSLTVPRIIRIINKAGKVQRELLKATNPLKEYTVGQTRVFSIKGEDSTLLWCRMILPHDFDSTKKYPTIVYVYGGPKIQLITDSWLAGADMWLHYLTQQGYIVFTLDNRGSGNRGKAFEQAVFRRLGDAEMNDQISGVNYLRKLSYIDKNRLGINGWSYGGFMTMSLMTRYPGIFKVAVAGGPVIDWSYYEIMYTERYMDTPEENAGAYKMNNLLNYVDQLNGKMMIIHGTDDHTVVWQHSLMYIKEAVSKGVQLDYFVYPGHEHNVTGKDRVHLNDKITRYFNDYLK